MSRKTGYKWVKRYETNGRRGLADQPRAPRQCPIAPTRISPTWSWRFGTRIRRGARASCGASSRDRHPDIRHWPAPSTVAELLTRHGLVTRRRRRRPSTHPGVVAPTTTPNDFWTADFKGQFRTSDHRYCYPLTIADHDTRFLLACRGRLSTETVSAWPVFERAFREYGLPRAIRTDNGVPFATQAIHGLSYLNVWWMRLGITHQRIHPGCPHENGAHERMHRTLKREAIKPVRGNCAAQQRNFDAFRREYNEERPHEFLHQETPASQYRPSRQPYPDRLPAPTYPGHFLVEEGDDGGDVPFPHPAPVARQCLGR